MAEAARGNSVTHFAMLRWAITSCLCAQRRICFPAGRIPCRLVPIDLREDLLHVAVERQPDDATLTTHPSGVTKDLMQIGPPTGSRRRLLSASSCGGRPTPYS